MIELLKNYPTGPSGPATVFIISFIIMSISILIALIKKENEHIFIIISAIALTITFSSIIYMADGQKNIKDIDFNVIRSDNKIIVKSKSDWVKSNSFEIFKEDDNNVYILDHNKIYTINKNDLN